MPSKSVEALDLYAVELTPNTPEQEAEARLYTAGLAIENDWSKEDLLEHLQALGLAEANLDPDRVLRSRKYPKKRKNK